MKRYLLLLVALFAAERASATTYVVTSPVDSVATGTLRWAILSVNTSPSPPHVVSFALASPYRITVTGALPAISAAVRVDGSTQAGFVGVPLVRVNGGGVVGGTAGLTIVAPSTTVRSLVVENFTTTGIDLTGVNAVGCRVEGCYIISNAAAGVYMDSGASNNVIGGVAASNRNVISRNATYGVVVQNDPNTVQGNYIGLDPTGTSAWSNTWMGVYLAGAHDAVIGGSVAGARNVISGNGMSGISVSGTGALRNVIAGNFIGLNAAGTGGVSNSQFGVELSGGATSNRVGGSEAERNVIAGNGYAGIHIAYGAGFNTIQANYIGSSSNGLSPIGNGWNASPRHGIFMEGSSGNQIVSNVVIASQSTGVGMYGTDTVANVLYGNRIGVNAAGARVSNNFDGIGVNFAVSNVIGLAGSISQRNIISGNNGQGIYVEAGSIGTVIQNNFIGTDPTGTNAIPNNGGVFLNDSSFTLVGGDTGTVNVISGNTYAGVYVSGGNSVSNRIQGNFIGVDLFGNKALPNGGPGVQLNVSTPGTVIGGGALFRNVISGNGGRGVTLGNNPSNITISANYIGVGFDGTSRVANVGGGIDVGGGVRCVIGGAGVGNVVSGNNDDGIVVNNSTNVQILGNYVGLDALGIGVVSNVGPGINVYNTRQLTVGEPGAGNWVCGNTAQGILISSPVSMTDAVVAANVVGLNTAGAARPNKGNGVDVENGPGIRIGGTAAGARNIVAGNEGAGIYVYGAPAAAIEGNFVGTATSGLAVVANGLYGIGVEGSSNALIRGNVIATTNGNAITVIQSNGSIVRSNWVGVGADGVTALGNSGILVSQSENVQVGGYQVGEGNRVAYSTGSGITIASLFNGVRLGNRIAGNTLYSNAIPIDLNADGPTANDPAPDADVGYANDFQNYPVLTNAFKGSTHIQGRLETAPGTYRVDVMAVAPASAAAYLGYADVTVNGTGTQTFSVVLGKSAPTGALIAATATDLNGSTSEMGPAVTNKLPPATDSDTDGLPDWWEDAHGLNPGVSNAPTNDVDGDTVFDVQEYFTDTDPSDSNSFLRIASLAASPQRTVSWPSSDSRQYNVQFATALAPATWNTIVSNLPGSGFTMTQLDTNPAGTQVFYRVRGGLP